LVAAALAVWTEAARIEASLEICVERLLKADCNPFVEVAPPTDVRVETLVKMRVERTET
jgi:site-specific recombinase